MIIYTLKNKKSKTLGNVVLGDNIEQIKRDLITLADTNKDQVETLKNYNLVQLGEYDNFKGIFNVPKKHIKLVDCAAVLKKAGY